MPWQTAPGVVIIIAAFSLTGALIPPIHWLFKGEARRGIESAVPRFPDARRGEPSVQPGASAVATLRSADPTSGAARGGSLQ